MEGTRHLLARSLVVVLVALACATPAVAAHATADRSAASASAPAGQLRSVWLDAFGDGLYTQAQIAQRTQDYGVYRYLTVR